MEGRLQGHQSSGTRDDSVVRSSFEADTLSRQVGWAKEKSLERTTRSSTYHAR